MTKQELQQAIKQALADGKVNATELENVSEGLLTVASRLNKGG